MKTIVPLIVAIALPACWLTTTSSAADGSSSAATNQLTPDETKTGWKLLFDGQSLKGWRNYKKPTAPDHGWEVKDGVLTCVAKARGGDIITVDTFTDFDLQWDWKIPAKANNGVKYLVTEDRPSAPGIEYQMIDESTAAAKPALRSTASFYDVLAPAEDKPLNPVGEWNHSRILLQGNHVEHWLNGKMVLTYELGSPEVRAAVAKSKFKSAPGFGEKIKGHIMLTEHQDEASYRNIKILELPPK